MAASIPTTEPTQFMAGESVQWTRSVPDYPAASGYSLVYYFAGVDTFDVTAGTDASGAYLVTLAPSDTAAKRAGTYRWRAFAEKSTTERWFVGSGVLTLEPNYATAEPGALQTHAERMLAAIEARIEGRLDADIESYGVAGRSVQQIPFEQLGRARAKYSAEVVREKNGGVLPPYAVSFTRPGF